MLQFLLQVHPRVNLQLDIPFTQFTHVHMCHLIAFRQFGYYLVSHLRILIKYNLYCTLILESFHPMIICLIFTLIGFVLNIFMNFDIIYLETLLLCYTIFTVFTG